jgi:dienelactone hydrolase
MAAAARRRLAIRRYARRVIRAVALLVLVAALVAGCGGSKSDESDTFAYDEHQPLGVEEGGRAPSSQKVVVREVSYASGKDRVEAFLVSPAGSTGEHPAVVLLHGAGGDRTEQLALAAKLAQRGFVALTLTAPSGTKTRSASLSPDQALRWERDVVVADVVAVRRAFDVLAGEEQVDRDRMGLVGWSAGARLATIVADVDDRVRATVLMSAGAVPVSEYVDEAPAEFRDAVREALTPIDPLSHVRRIRGALFVQAGSADTIVPERALRSVAEAAPEGTRVTWYEAGHALDEQAERDRIAWLSDQLGGD